MRCPVCRSGQGEPGLVLTRQPIYQHPVSPEVRIDPPWFKDLVYLFCRECGHAYLGEDDAPVLTRLYREYYYTPRPAGLGAGFRQVFFDVLDRDFAILQRSEHILEVGCSSGEMLGQIGLAYPETRLAGFEPNRETAAVARKFGIEVYEAFFEADSALAPDRRFDLIFHRHVLEHVLSFDGFFKAHDMLANPGAHLVIETPCLNLAVANHDLAAFHIEHRHLFSLSSLSALGARYGWVMTDYRLTGHGAMIGLFSKQGSPCEITLDRVAGLSPLSDWVFRNQRRIAEASAGKRLAVWGAGSGGVKAINYFNLSPEVLVDGNPAKAGKVFAGFEHLAITEASGWVAAQLAASSDWLILVASAYSQEIASFLADQGWQGPVIGLYAVS